MNTPTQRNAEAVLRAIRDYRDLASYEISGAPPPPDAASVLPTVEDIAINATVNGITIPLAEVVRTLEGLVRSGLVTRHFHTPKVRYGLTDASRRAVRPSTKSS